MFHVLNDDEVIKVFIFLFIHSDENEPFNFLQTCKRFSEMFGVNANGIGSAQYINFVHSKRVRCSSLAEKIDKVLNLKFTEQVAIEAPFHHMVQCFMKADSVNTMHCSSICCEKSRKTFNENESMRYKLLGTMPTGRCVCAATDSYGNPVEFSLYRAFGGICFLSKTIHDKDSGARMCEITLNERQIPSINKNVDSISCSPCGTHLIYRCNLSYYHWDTSVNDAPASSVKEIRYLKIPLEELAIPYTVAGLVDSQPMQVWWTRCSTMLIAWQVIPDGTEHDSADPNQRGFAITAQDVDGTNQRLVMSFQYGNEFNLTFSGWYVIKDRVFMDQKKSILVYDFSNGPDDVKTSSVSCLNEDNAYIGQASHELFVGLCHPCISHDGNKLAILAYACEHEYKQRPAKPVDTRLVDDHMIFVLFTRSADGKFYYRMRGHNDECFFPVKTAIQGVTNFELGFSPCESIVHVIYASNRYNTHYDAYAYPSGCFVRIMNKQIKRTQPVFNTKIREICWDYPKSLIVLPRHGAVRFVPKQ